MVLDDETQIYGVPGREAYHIFNLHKKTYLGGLKNLRYTILYDDKKEDDDSSDDEQ
jgi:hypothetical protein